MTHMTINQTREEGLRQHFVDGIGSRVFILTRSYPFTFIGEIVSVMDDMIEIFVETTHFAQLENRLWFLHTDNIEVFYIEREGEPEIPSLSDAF